MKNWGKITKIRKAKSKSEARVPIADGFFLPNLSGDYSVGRAKTPVAGGQVANKDYVDNAISGIPQHEELTLGVANGLTLSAGQVLSLPVAAEPAFNALTLPSTTTSSTGVIFKEANRFMHDFHHPTGNTAVPVGQNTFIGINAGNFTMGETATESYQASYNTAIGHSALHANTSGYCNAAIGKATLYANTTGHSNAAIGHAALYANTTGRYNVAIGHATLYANTTGYYNVAIGYAALYANTTGCYNTAVGNYALYANTSGFYNTAIGNYALYANTTGQYNTAIGHSALYANTTGQYNTAIGLNAGRFITGGTNPNQTSNTSVYLGNLTKASANGNSNEIVIGYNVTGHGNNTATYGNASITAQYFTGQAFVETNKRVACGGGTTGSSTTPNGTVSLIINGTTYHLLTSANA